LSELEEIQERIRNFSKGAINNIVTNVIVMVLTFTIHILVFTQNSPRAVKKLVPFLIILFLSATIYNIFIWVRLYRNFGRNLSTKNENYLSKQKTFSDIKSPAYPQINLNKSIKKIKLILDETTLLSYLVIALFSFLCFMTLTFPILGAIAFFISVYQIWKRKQKLIKLINNYKPIIKNRLKQIIIFIKKHAKNSKENIADYYHKSKNKKKIKWGLILLTAILLSIYPINKLYQNHKENSFNKESVDEEITNEESVDEDMTNEESVDEELADEEMADEEMADEELVNEINSEQEKSEFQMNSLDNKDITKNYISAKIIIGSFGAKENAEKLKKSLLNEGFENIDISKIGNINRVSILVSGSKEKAQEILKKVKVNHKSAWISYN
tara:strand:+ start:1133 stop:2284 length:1152 start_codon:yes stop_codon:yes gene_type:complete